jgi:hypothetical protein
MEPLTDLAAAIGAAAGQELKNAFERIKHCTGQLSDEQVWWRPSTSMNAIGNLILHLQGNIRQWLISGLGGTPDVRDRPREFAERGPIAKDQLLRRLEEVVGEARQIMTRISSADLLRRRRIQGYDVTGLDAIFDSVPHFRGHTQEIIHITRCLLGEAYQFAPEPYSLQEKT